MPSPRVSLTRLEAHYQHWHWSLLDNPCRSFNAEVPQVAQWDDHETTNNWFPGGVIDERNPRFTQYTVTSHDLLAAYAKRAFCEYTPMRFDAHDLRGEKIYSVDLNPEV